MNYSNATRFEFDPLEFALAHGFVLPPSWERRTQWERDEICARYLDDRGVDIRDTRSTYA